VPAGTPDAVIARINADVNAALNDATVRAALDNQGLTPVGGSAADFRKTVESDMKRWGPIINRIGLKIEQ
jgi:tripartite-type tricarboxylate transporter receptor subunit TctC